MKENWRRREYSTKIFHFLVSNKCHTTNSMAHWFMYLQCCSHLFPSIYLVCTFLSDFWKLNKRQPFIINHMWPNWPISIDKALQRAQKVSGLNYHNIASLISLNIKSHIYIYIYMYIYVGMCVYSSQVVLLLCILAVLERLIDGVETHIKRELAS